MWNMGWETLEWTDTTFLFHATTENAWTDIIRTGIKRGGRRGPQHRAEVFFSSSSYVTGAGPNPHTDIPPYVFQSASSRGPLAGRGTSSTSKNSTRS